VLTMDPEQCEFATGVAARATVAAETTRKSHRIGCDRTIDPSATLTRILPFLPVCGITRVANLTGLDAVGVPVVAVCRPNSRSVAVSQGKGLTLAAAKASGIMEAIEAYHAEFATLALYRDTLAGLERRGATVADVRALPKTSAVHFRPDTKVLWTAAEDVVSGQSVLVPYEMVHTDYTLPLPPGSGCFLMSSNGLASGNHRLEAVSHGLCELVERDAVTLHGLSSAAERASRRVDLSTIEDPSCLAVLQRFQAAGLAVTVHDVTSDVGIAVFRCDVSEKNEAILGSMPPLRGTGCHPRREIALLRALTEAAQTRVTMISGARDDLSPWWYSDRDRVAAVRRSFFESFERNAERRFDEAPHFDSPLLSSDVAWEIGQLERAGMSRTLVVDLTKPEMGIPVARVIVPGLEPMREAPGYVPGERARRQMLRGTT